MKKYIITVMVILLGFTLVACSKEQNLGGVVDFSETLGKKTELRVWMDDEKGEYMEALVAEFNKLYPEIHVKFLHKGSVDSREHLKTFGPSGNGADVFQFPHDHLAQAILEDLVLALPSATRTKVEERAHELGVQIATLSYDETTGSFDPSNPNSVPALYAVPMSLESVGLYYNKDLVETPAKTYEELFTFADTWNAKVPNETDGRTNAQLGNYAIATSSHWADSYFMQHIYSAFGFKPFGPTLDNPSKVGYEDAADALAWMRDELKPRATGTSGHDQGPGGAGFEDGIVPYIIAGPWNIEAYKNKGLNFGVAELPTINGKDTQSFAGAMMAAVYKYSQNQEEAIKFVEFLNSDIAMSLQYEYKNKLPALKDDLLVNIEGVLEDQYLVAMSNQLKTSIPMPTIPQVTYYWGPGESMIKDLWNDPSSVIADLVERAESSYRTNVGLGQ